MKMQPADFRAEIGRRRLVIYVLAAEIGVYPGRLGRMLNERMPMPAAITEKLSRALDCHDDGASVGGDRSGGERGV